MSRENKNFDFDRAYVKKYYSYRLQTWWEYSSIIARNSREIWRHAHFRCGRGARSRRRGTKSAVLFEALPFHSRDSLYSLDLKYGSHMNTKLHPPRATCTRRYLRDRDVSFLCCTSWLVSLSLARPQVKLIYKLQTIVGFKPKALVYYSWSGEVKIVLHDTFGLIYM